MTFARIDAAAMLAQAEAARLVVEAETTAAADVLAQEAGVYADERDYVRAKLYAKTAPCLRSVLVGDEKDGVFGLPVRRAPGTGAPPSTWSPGADAAISRRTDPRRSPTWRRSTWAVPVRSPVRVRPRPSVRGTAAGGADAFGARAGTKTGEQEAAEPQAGPTRSRPAPARKQENRRPEEPPRAWVSMRGKVNGIFRLGRNPGVN